MEDNLQLNYDATLYAWVREKGLEVPNVDFALNKLSEVSPFHLESYGQQWMDKRTGRYKEGTSFDQIYETYHADRCLKDFLFDYLAELEVQLRNVLAYFIEHKYGAQGYLNPDNFVNPDYHDNFINEVKLEASRANEPYMKAFEDKELEDLPVVVALDIVTFGSLSKLFGNLKGEDKDAIARFYRLDTEVDEEAGRVMASYLKALTDLRNICAHHGRLSWRRFKQAPLILASDLALVDQVDPGFRIDPYGFFAALLALFHLIEPERKGDLQRDMARLFALHPHFERQALSLPLGWEEVLAES